MMRPMTMTRSNSRNRGMRIKSNSSSSFSSKESTTESCTDGHEDSYPIGGNQKDKQQERGTNNGIRFSTKRMFGRSQSERFTSLVRSGSFRSRVGLSTDNNNFSNSTPTAPTVSPSRRPRLLLARSMTNTSNAALAEARQQQPSAFRSFRLLSRGRPLVVVEDDRQDTMIVEDKEEPMGASRSDDKKNKGTTSLGTCASSSSEEMVRSTSPSPPDTNTTKRSSRRSKRADPLGVQSHHERTTTSLARFLSYDTEEEQDEMRYEDYQYQADATPQKTSSCPLRYRVPRKSSWAAMDMTQVKHELQKRFPYSGRPASGTKKSPVSPEDEQPAAVVEDGTPREATPVQTATVEQGPQDDHQPVEDPEESPTYFSAARSNSNISIQDVLEAYNRITLDEDEQ